MDKKMLTAEELLEKVTELGYDVSLEDCEEAADFVNNEPMTEDGEFAELDEDALEDVVGGAISIKAIKKWLVALWNNRPGKSPGKLSSWEKDIVKAAKKKFGNLGASIATGFFMLY